MRDCTRKLLEHHGAETLINALDEAIVKTANERDSLRAALEEIEERVGVGRCLDIAREALAKVPR